MITPFLIFLFQLLTEKKEKIKEYMKIMGLTDTAYYSSWLFHEVIVLTILMLSITYILTETTFVHSSFLLIFLWLFFATMLLISKAVFLSSLFTSARAGIVLGGLIFFLESLLPENFARPDVANSSIFEHLFWSFSLVYASNRASPLVIALETQEAGL